jgi:hypothetical protein
VKIEVVARDEETGEVKIEGYLNRHEMGFLVQFAINELVADGVEFNLTYDEPDDDDEPRITYPKGQAN